MTNFGTLQSIGKSSYVYEQPDGGWCVNNAGLIVGSRTSLLVDTVATERRAEALRSALTSALSSRGQPAVPHFLVNTHFHGDHTFGNHLFRPGTTIIAHRECAREQVEAGQGLRGLWPQVEWGRTPVEEPDVVYDQALSIDLGGLQVELLHLERAHTSGDTVVWLEDERVLYTGDVTWSRTTPFCLMGSVTGSLDALERLRRLQPETIVPGHGPAGGVEILEATERYLSWVLVRAGQGLAAGRSPLETAQAADLGEFASLLDSERLVGNLHRAYSDLTGRPMTPADLAHAFGDMITLNAGLPVCAA